MFKPGWRSTSLMLSHFLLNILYIRDNFWHHMFYANEQKINLNSD